MFTHRTARVSWRCRGCGGRSRTRFAWGGVVGEAKCELGTRSRARQRRSSPRCSRRDLTCTCSQPLGTSCDCPPRPRGRSGAARAGRAMCEGRTRPRRRAASGIRGSVQAGARWVPPGGHEVFAGRPNRPVTGHAGGRMTSSASRGTRRFVVASWSSWSATSASVDARIFSPARCPWTVTSSHRCPGVPPPTDVPLLAMSTRGRRSSEQPRLSRRASAARRRTHSGRPRG